MSKYNDSHLSVGDRTGNEEAPLNMHKRAKLGLKVDGRSNPNGAAKGSTENKIKSNAGKTY